MTADVAPDLRADASAPLATSKAIVLFSDGTGNSSGKLFKTNVFRLYQALDLGSRANAPDQIAYYDNGVGTSSIRALALLGGVFGFGLKRNVRAIYRFLCRNYNEGDRIYAFGFSRGAFTIRLLVALICKHGIVPYADERELRENTADAFYAFIDANEPDRFPYLWRAIRYTRNGVRYLWRRVRRRQVNVEATQHPDVEFVGVWDTVAAYGGPISEITRGIDQYAWPLTMANYELPTKVKAARHALALDDERDSFWPLLWDEVNEERLQASPDAGELQPPRDRLKQVWFAGVHSDVGGGYPDDSLSYVSLVWMIDELGSQLRFLPTEERRIRRFANPLGPIHDSRRGLGAYYRYQPRRIAALLHSSVSDTLSFDETLILRDPTIGEKRTPPQGLLTSCQVHESVIQRIGSGTDNYAPIVLPRDFAIVPGPRGSRIDERVVAALQDPKIAAARSEAQENAWDDVWRRRAGYFVVVALTLLLVAAPLYATRIHVLPETDERWILDTVIGWLGRLVPGFAQPWFEAFRLTWPLILAVLLIIAIVAGRMKTQSDRLHDELRRGWWSAIEGKEPDQGAPSWLRLVRNSLAYQWTLQSLKWRVLPFVIGWTVIALVPYLSALALTQGGLWIDERRDKGTTAGRDANDAFCTNSGVGKPIMSSQRLRFAATEPCATTGFTVAAGRRYRLVFRSLNPNPSAAWRDRGYAVPIEGQTSAGFASPVMPLMYAAAPFRRVVPARWLEPLVEVRSAATTSPYTRFVGSRIAIERLKPLRPPQKQSTAKGIYAGEFTARFAGSLHLFLNDAAIAFAPSDYLYRNNAGEADVCIEPVGEGALKSLCGVDGWTYEDPRAD